MKSIYRRHVHEILDGQIPSTFPGYTLRPIKLAKLKRKGATLFPGSRLYSRAVPEGTLFIHLIPHRRQERLQAEVGWSATDRFPIELSSQGPLIKPANELLEPEWMIDFGELYHRKHKLGFLGWDVWTCSVSADDPNFLKVFMEEDLVLVSEDQARERAETAVAGCLKDLQDVAIPYLNEWVETRRSRG
jgi:hypothetical protein